MEAGNICGCDSVPSYDGVLRNGINRHALFANSVLTDSVVEELKKQSSEGCLLCSFEAWDNEEDWD
jgi:hypothetical protein